MEVTLENKVLHKAVEFFMKYGVKSVSMDDIAGGLGISKKTLYNVVDSKAELLHQALLYHLEIEKAFITKAREEAEDAIHEMITISRFFVQILRQHKPSLIFEVQKYYPEVFETMQSFNRGFIGQFVHSNIESGIAAGLYRDDFNVDVRSRFYVSQIRLLTDTEIFPLDKFPRAELYEEFITHHMYGMMTAKGIKRFEKILAQ